MGEPRAPAAARMHDRLGDRDAGVERQHSPVVDRDRIEVHFADLRNVDGDLGDLHQGQRHGMQVRARPVAEPLQKPADPRAANERLGQVEIERGEGKGHVAHDLDSGASMPEADDRAEGCVVGKADEDLARMGMAHHGLEHDAGNACVRMGSGDTRQQVACGFLDGLRCRQVEDHAPDVGLERQFRRNEFERQPVRVLQQPGRDGRRLFRIAGKAAFNLGDPVGGENPAHVRRLSQVSPLSSVARTMRRAVSTSGEKSVGRLGGAAMSCSRASA